MFIWFHILQKNRKIPQIPIFLKHKIAVGVMRGGGRLYSFISALCTNIPPPHEC